MTHIPHQIHCPRCCSTHYDTERCETANRDPANYIELPRYEPQTLQHTINGVPDPEQFIFEVSRQFPDVSVTRAMYGDRLSFYYPRISVSVRDAIVRMADQWRAERSVA